MRKKIAYFLVFGFIASNIVAFNHAYKFSHFNTEQETKTKRPEELSLLNKILVLATGISNPKPINIDAPKSKYETVKIPTHHNYTLDCWNIKVDSAIGTALLFHGYTGRKSDLIKEAMAFNEIGYNTVLVDFYGSGDSDGAETTVGYFEGEDVVNVYNYFKKGNDKIILYGASMGAVAIANAVANHKIEPSALILECPYGKILSTVKNRFEIMKVPSFGFAELLVFWGGTINGYWGFKLNTIKFAKKINTPTLILTGKEDKRANIEEVNEIYNNLKGTKRLKVFENAKHESYLKLFPNEWKFEIAEFLK